MSARAGVIIAAGGAGRRIGGAHKPFLELAGEPMLVHALRPFLAHPAVVAAVVAVPEDVARDPPDWLARLDARVRLVPGGVERADSVRNALHALPDSVDVVLVHDAARPLVTGEIVDRVLAAAVDGGGAIAAIPVADTLKEVGPDGRVVATLDRRRYRRAQTPQAFPRELLLAAYEKAGPNAAAATDEAALVERFGGTVRVAEGSVENLKITELADLVVAEALLHRRSDGSDAGAGAAGTGR